MKTPRFGPGTRPALDDMVHDLIVAAAPLADIPVGQDRVGEFQAVRRCHIDDLKVAVDRTRETRRRFMFASMSAVAPEREANRGAIREALILAIGEGRALLTWGDRVKPRGWAHVRANHTAAIEAYDKALAIIDGETVARPAGEVIEHPAIPEGVEVGIAVARKATAGEVVARVLRATVESQGAALAPFAAMISMVDAEMPDRAIVQQWRFMEGDKSVTRSVTAGDVRACQPLAIEAAAAFITTAREWKAGNVGEYALVEAIGRLDAAMKKRDECGDRVCEGVVVRGRVVEDAPGCPFLLVDADDEVDGEGESAVHLRRDRFPALKDGDWIDVTVMAVEVHARR